MEDRLDQGARGSVHILPALVGTDDGDLLSLERFRIFLEAASAKIEPKIISVRGAKRSPVNLDRLDSGNGDHLFTPTAVADTAFQFRALFFCSLDQRPSK